MIKNGAVFCKSGLHESKWHKNISMHNERYVKKIHAEKCYQPIIRPPKAVAKAHNVIFESDKELAPGRPPLSRESELSLGGC